MFKRLKPAGAILAFTIALGLPMRGLQAVEDQVKPAEDRAKPAKVEAEPAQYRAKPAEEQAKAEKPQSTTDETVPEVRETGPSNGMKTFDALAVRPVTFVSSVFSAGAFVLALPFAALDPAMDVEKTRKNLVDEPFQDTFQRPLGDFNGSAWGQP